MTTSPFARADLPVLLADHEPPCLSIYMPTHRHHPENQQDPIRYKNLLKSLEQLILQHHSAADAEVRLEPYRALANNTSFWNHTWRGLAVLGSADLFRVVKLHQPVPELAIAADTFHITPLLRMLQSVELYQVLSLSRKEIRLFEGDRHHLDEVELAPGVPRTIKEALGEELTEPHQTVASYGGTQFGSDMRHSHGGKADEEEVDLGRFFRVVDRAILEHHSQPSGLPLMLAALTEYHTAFRAISHNPFLIEKGLEVDPSALTSHQLRARAWSVMESAMQKRLQSLCEVFQLAKSKGTGSDDPAIVAKAAAESRVDSLLIEAERRIPGQMDPQSGVITPSHATDLNGDDLLDDVAELVLNRGGSVVVVAPEDMPTTSGIAATFRF